jgi:hypothetical protein
VTKQTDAVPRGNKLGDSMDWVEHASILVYHSV